MEAQLPQVFGRYVLTGLIGEGGMAEVYRATVRVAEGLTKQVVIKKIRKEFADQPEFTRMFVDEAKIALSLNHANIVQVFDFGQVRGVFYLAMELVEGSDVMRLFHAVLGLGDAFPPVIAAYIGHQVAAGLAYAHRKNDDYGRPLGIVHRDVSPHNIMVSFEGQVKILDFGIARTKARALESRPDDPSGQGPPEETIKGKVAYMSPEQANGRPLDARSDVYSIGVVLYEILTGALLFRTKDRILALELVRSQPIVPLGEVAPDLPVDLLSIVDKALARDPDERYETARALQSALAAFLHNSDPVVDDEVLSNFVSQYATRGPRIVPHTLDQQLTREIGDSHGSIAPAMPKQESQRVIVVHVALEPRPTGPDDPPPDPSAFISLARDVAFKREAQVLRADVGGLLLVLGSLLTTGDDGERGLRLALALREEVAESAPGVAVGICVASVPAIIRHGGASAVDVQIEASLRRHIERLARRSLDGPIIVSSDQAERLARSWRFADAPLADDMEETLARRHPELMAPAKLVGPAGEAERRAQFGPGGRPLLLGRELELKTLRDTFSEAIRSRESRAAVIVGAPGIGKRALTERFVGSLPRTACSILRAAASWSRRNVPLGVFLDLLASFLRIERETTREQIARTLHGHDVRDAVELADVLAAALGVADVPPSPPDPLRERDQIWRLVRRLIRGLAQRRPVLILVENIHFADAPSMELLLQWVQHRHPFPILGLSTGREGPRVDELRRQDNVVAVELGELDQNARVDMIIQRFEDPEQASELAHKIVAHTGGNPLFIDEALAFLLQTGVVAWGPSGRHLQVRTPGAKIEMPPSIDSALAARVEDLSPGDREVLQGAAILGRLFRLKELGKLLDRSVSKALENLVNRGFLDRAPLAHAPGESARFTTVSLHDVVKAGIPDDIAALWHGRCADLKRGREDYQGGRDDGPLAEHLISAGRLEEAAACALRAAAHAKLVAGNTEAYYFLSQAIKALGPEDPRRFDALMEREQVLRAWGRRRARSADIRQMLQIAAKLGDPQRDAIASLRLLRLYLEAGRIHRAERLVPALQEQIDGLRHPAPFRAAAGELISRLLLERGHFEEALTAAADALINCEDDERGRRQRCRLHAAAGRVHLQTGKFDDARAAYEDALAIADTLGERRLQADVQNALGEVAGRSTRYQDAVDHFLTALDIDRDLGDRFSTGRKLANLGMTYSALGLYRRAERYLRKALELHEAVDDSAEYNDVAVHLGEVLVGVGQAEAGIALLQEAANVAQRRGDTRTHLRATTRLALAQIQDSDDPQVHDSARATAAEAVDVSREEGLRTAGARAHYVLALAAAAAGDPKGHRAKLEETVKLVAAGAAPIEAPRYLHAYGQLLASQGDGDAARYLEQAADIVRGRLESLRDPQLRQAYEALDEVQEILRAPA